jgi:hypothetical protein
MNHLLAMWLLGFVFGLPFGALIAGLITLRGRKKRLDQMYALGRLHERMERPVGRDPP